MFVFPERISVGLDVHARSISAAAIDLSTGEEFKARLCPGDNYREVLAWLESFPGPVAVAYEAGPTGFGLARLLGAEGIRCVVAAPSKIARPSGDRVKTDAKDAALLARLLLHDDLAEVRVPSVSQEAARDLVRFRNDIRFDLMSERNRLSKLLLRHGHVYAGGTTWTLAHFKWMESIHFDELGTKFTVQESIDLVKDLKARRDRIDQQIASLAADSEFTQVVRNLCCLRGISTLTGFALAVEIGDWTRFTGSSIGHFLGLTPSEHSSGGKRSLGGVTKAGNSHARRLLVEASWHHLKPYRKGKTLTDRWQMVPLEIQRRADQANRRLHNQWKKFQNKGKKNVVANTAIARELAGFCWSLATIETN